MQETLDILKKHKLSITEARLAILDIFTNNEEALSHSEIEDSTKGNFDRVTLYRTLQTFVEKGLIHQIPTTDNGVRYALCKENCEEGHHHDEHVHFVCMNCNRTICLEHVIIPKVRLPKGFFTSQVDMIVKGTCDECTN
jgi:Fur family ferric uptake transcriptional regulator